MGDELEANYDAMHTAADAGDAVLTKQLADAVIADGDATDQQKSFANLRAGETLTQAGRNEEAKPYLLQAASLGDASVQERAYQLLSDLAQFEGAVTDDILGGQVPSRLAAAREAVERGDEQGALDLATSIFDDDQAEPIQKAAASLIAAEANFKMGRDDHAELYAEWASQHGDAEQKEEARTLLARWKRYERADRSMDDGVTTTERPPILDAAAHARNNSDWPTAERLLTELNEKEGAELTAEQHKEMAYGLGEALYYQARYEEAKAWFARVPESLDGAGLARQFVEHIDQLLAQTRE
jgi:hypothetical protein